MRAKCSKGGRFQHHPRPHFSSAEVIEKAERGLAQNFGGKIDADFRIVMNGQIAFQSVYRGADESVFMAADNVEMRRRKRRWNERAELFEQTKRARDQSRAAANGPAFWRA